MVLPFPIPASLSPAFTMSHATAADAESLAEIYYTAFQTGPGNTYWWPAEKEPMMEWTVRRTRNKMRDQTMRHFKVTDAQTGDVVAFARWDIPHGSTKFGGWLGGDEQLDVSELVGSGGEEAVRQPAASPAPAPAPLTGGSEKPAMDIPPGADAELCRDFFDGLSRMSSKWMAQDMLSLSLIATSTEYFKRGAAKALILPMLDIADAEGVKAYLEATPAGKPVYEKMGFREVDSLEFNLDELTKDHHGIYRLCIMIREPKATSI